MMSQGHRKGPPRPPPPGKRARGGATASMANTSSLSFSYNPLMTDEDFEEELAALAPTTPKKTVKPSTKTSATTTTDSRLTEENSKGLAIGEKERLEDSNLRNRKEEETKLMSAAPASNTESENNGVSHSGDQSSSLDNELTVGNGDRDDVGQHQFPDQVLPPQEPRENALPHSDSIEDKPTEESSDSSSSSSTSGSYNSEDIVTTPDDSLQPSIDKYSGQEEDKTSSTLLPKDSSPAIVEHPLLQDDDDNDQGESYFEPLESSQAVKRADKEASRLGEPARADTNSRKPHSPINIPSSSLSPSDGLLRYETQPLRGAEGGTSGGGARKSVDRQPSVSLTKSGDEEVLDPLTAFSRMADEQESPPPTPPLSHYQPKRTPTRARSLETNPTLPNLISDHYQLPKPYEVFEPAPPAAPPSTPTHHHPKVHPTRSDPSRKVEGSSSPTVAAAPMTVSLSGLLAVDKDDASKAGPSGGQAGVRRPRKTPAEEPRGGEEGTVAGVRRPRGWQDKQQQLRKEALLKKAAVSAAARDQTDGGQTKTRGAEEDMSQERGAAPAPSLDSVPTYTLCLLALAMFAYFVIPLPPYAAGMLMGFQLSFATLLCMLWLNVPPAPKELSDLPTPEVMAQSVLAVPLSKGRTREGEKIIYKGWMNELVTYDPDNYHVSQTASVLVRLEGYSLRLSQPKQNIPRKAMWDEPEPNPIFVHQRHFDLRGSKVTLLPEGLVRKRYWSKKYPICIELDRKGTKKVRPAEEPTDSYAFAQARKFDVITQDECEDTVLYLFSRTGRDKEDWFRKLVAASRHDLTRGREVVPTLAPQPLLVDDINSEVALLKAQKFLRVAAPRGGGEEGAGSPTAYKATLHFYKYISRFIPQPPVAARGPSQAEGGAPRGSGVQYTSPVHRRDKVQAAIDGSPASWFNAGVGRFFWDFLREDKWATWISNKIQRKLSKLKVPYFMNELTITEIDPGVATPIILRTSAPVLDDRGLWVDLDVVYQGSFCMTLETKLNLWKLAKENRPATSKEEVSYNADSMQTKPTLGGGGAGTPSPKTSQRKRESRLKRPKSLHDKLSVNEPPGSAAAFDSEEEDSAESSEEEEAGGPQTTVEPAAPSDLTDGGSGGSYSKKFLRLVDRVAKSKYFQQATEYKYVKKAFNGVSNTPLVLTVEVKGLRGTLAVNIPPPPTDRIWYGFRPVPELMLSARPKLGERKVTFSHITDWIEKKLGQEFQKVFVLPNMDDLVVPIMNDHLEQEEGSTVRSTSLPSFS